MNILDALTELYTKVVGSAPAPADNIGDMIQRAGRKLAGAFRAGTGRAGAGRKLNPQEVRS